MLDKVMTMEEHWERIKDEQLMFLVDENSKADPREKMLQTLVQTAARN